MGGFGSGNFAWAGEPKQTVEDCHRLVAGQLAKAGALQLGAWTRGSWGWQRGGKQTASIGFEASAVSVPLWLRLYYTFAATGQEIEDRVELTVTRPHFGGVRWWFLCPLGQDCRRRVAKLFLPPGERYFGCRRCHELTYTSCQKSRKPDALERRIAAQIGCSGAEVRRIVTRAVRAELGVD